MVYVIHVITKKLYNTDWKNNLGKFIVSNLNKISNIVFVRVACMYFHLTVSENVNELSTTITNKDQKSKLLLVFVKKKKIIYEKCSIIFSFFKLFLTGSFKVKNIMLIFRQPV